VDLSDYIAAGRSVLVFTGAGISTASGIPDFRGPQGVWNTRRPVFFDEFVASEEARSRYWQQKLEDRRAWSDARPNAVHHAIVALERAGRVGMVVTQNIDGLHRAAGSSVDRLVEVHGTTAEVACLDCDARSDPEPHFAAFASSGRAPVCRCGGLLKPATISFGQNLRSDDIERAFAAAAECDLVVALGSSLSVTPAANIPLAAARRGAPYVIVNRGPTEHDDHPAVTLRVEADVLDVFPTAVAAALDQPPRPTPNLGTSHS